MASEGNEIPEDEVSRELPYVTKCHKRLADENAEADAPSPKKSKISIIDSATEMSTNSKPQPCSSADCHAEGTPVSTNKPKVNDVSKYYEEGKVSPEVKLSMASECNEISYDEISFELSNVRISHKRLANENAGGDYPPPKKTKMGVFEVATQVSTNFKPLDVPESSNFKPQPCSSAASHAEVKPESTINPKMNEVPKYYEVGFRGPWNRLEKIKVCGEILQYTGRGNCIKEIGLAQARLPLTPANHYFELKIVNPGEKCFISIGLTSRDHPKYMQAGWCQGSIGYNADDGKLYFGSFGGDSFGPCCRTGDRMGCGIIFPYNYVPHDESAGNSSSDSSVSPTKDVVDLLNLLDFHDKKNNYWKKKENRCGMEANSNVNIFFTKNGKTIGVKKASLPKGGFFPTIGMSSVQEKVRVDLRPLTG